MRELTSNELCNVTGAVSQDMAVGGNIAIATTGMGIALGMETAGLALSATGVGIVAGMILVSAALTLSYLME